MKRIAAIATGALMMANPADAAPKPAVQHYGNPTLNGQALPFSEAVRVGEVLYLSGQLGRGPDGKLPEGIEAQTRQTLDNIGATLKLAGLTHADIAVACFATHLREAVPLSLDPWPALRGHVERCEALPVFRAHYQPFAAPVSTPAPTAKATDA